MCIFNAKPTVSFLAIIPLAQLLTFATEELSFRLGQTLAGLLNATLVRSVTVTRIPAYTQLALLGQCVRALYRRLYCPSNRFLTRDHDRSVELIVAVSTLPDPCPCPPMRIMRVFVTLLF